MDRLPSTVQAKGYQAPYERAFDEFAVFALWYLTRLDDPTPEDALVVARALRREGNMDARRLAEEIEQECHAPH